MGTAGRSRPARAGGGSRRAPLEGQFAAPTARSSLQQHQSATHPGPPRRTRAYWNRFPLAPADSGTEECRSPDCGGAGASSDAHPRTGHTAKGRRRPARPPDRAGRRRPTSQRAPPSPNACSTTSSTRTAPGLSSGALPLPHLGDCTHEGQPVRHSHPEIAARVAASQRGSTSCPRSAKPAAAGVPVVHEDRRAAGVRVQRGRHAADVPAVADREQRQYPDGGVLGGVQRSGHPRDVHPDARRGRPRRGRTRPRGCAASAAGGRAARSPAPCRPVPAAGTPPPAWSPSPRRTPPAPGRAHGRRARRTLRRRPSSGRRCASPGRRRCTSATPASRSRSCTR